MLFLIDLSKKKLHIILLSFLAPDLISDRESREVLFIAPELITHFVDIVGQDIIDNRRAHIDRMQEGDFQHIIDEASGDGPIDLRISQIIDGIYENLHDQVGDFRADMRARGFSIDGVNIEEQIIRLLQQTLLPDRMPFYIHSYIINYVTHILGSVNNPESIMGEAFAQISEIADNRFIEYRVTIPEDEIYHNPFIGLSLTFWS